MTTYVKPLFAPIQSDVEVSGCCFYYNNAGQGFYYYSGGKPSTDISSISLGRALGAVGDGSTNILTIGNNGGSATPLCGTGLPATQPQTFGIPAGVTGVNVTVAGNGHVTADVDPSTLGVSVAGQQVVLPVIACTTVSC